MPTPGLVEDKIVSQTTPSSTIRVHHRSSHTLPSAVVKKIINLSRGIILRAKDPMPAGSPQLIPHYSSLGSRACKITEKRVENIYIYAFSNPSSVSPKKRHELYVFCGGGFKAGPTNQHWALCAEICAQLPEYDVNLVSYPLVPNSPAATSLPQLEALYHTLELEAQKNGTKITLMGDSAGGNIVLVLGIYAATRWLNDNKNAGHRCPLQNIFAICPATDLRHQHVDIDKTEANDPILSRKMIEEVANGWRGEISASDPRISPTFADLSVFNRANVKVDGMVGGYDVLAPEGIQFREKLAEADVQGDWLEWEKQMHCFVLMFQYHIPESRAAMDWILKILKENILER